MKCKNNGENVYQVRKERECKLKGTLIEIYIDGCFDLKSFSIHVFHMEK